MGGWHWGHRYIIDTTPAIFLATCYLLRGKKWLTYAIAAILLLGFLFNLWGSICVYGALDWLKPIFAHLPLSV